MDVVLSNLQIHPGGINKNVLKTTTQKCVCEFIKFFSCRKKIYNTVQMFGVGKIFIKKSFQSLQSLMLPKGCIYLIKNSCAA